MVKIKKALRQNPRAAEANKRFLKRHGTKLRQFAERLKAELDDELICVFLLPPEKRTRKQKTEGSKAKESTSCDVYVLVSDIKSHDILKRIKEREKTIRTAFKATGLDNNLLQDHVIHLSGLWQLSVDSVVNKEDIIERMEKALLLNDSFVFLTFVLALHHKNHIIRRFGEYVLCYCFSGSMVRGGYTKDSDLDIFCVINDVDVKKMSLSELKERLRWIIHMLGHELAEEFNIPLNVNPQVYVLTDFWEWLRDGNPIILNLLRDAVPLFDKGMFAPWKQLLHTGRIRTSLESAEQHKSSAKYAFDQVNQNIKGIGEDGLYFALLNYAQAALMLAGKMPPAPQETAKLFKDQFCKPPYNFPEASLAALKETILVRKQLEHGTKKRFSLADLIKLYDVVVPAYKDFEKLFKVLRQDSRIRALDELDRHLTNTLNKYVAIVKASAVSEIQMTSLMPYMSNIQVGGITIRDIVKRLSQLRRHSSKGKPPSQRELAELHRKVGLVLNSMQQFTELLATASPQTFRNIEDNSEWLVCIGKRAGLALRLSFAKDCQPYKIQLNRNGNAAKGIQEIGMHEVLLQSHMYRGPNEKFNYSSITSIPMLREVDDA